jgi:hypothetical protein
MEKFLQPLVLGCIASLLVSCASSTPHSRIQEKPQQFEKLTEKHKEMVQRGEIARGMNKDAVWFAWGMPAAQIEGAKNGKFTERWDYQGRYPVTTNRFFGGYSTGGYSRGRYSGYDGGFGPEVTYVPYVRASVWFLDGRVDEWERQK